MKMLCIFFLLFLLSDSLLFSQVAINTDGSDPDASAGLDVSYANKGFLLPRLTQTQILSIQSPANGLIVFCTTDKKYYTFLEEINTWKEILYGSGTLFPCESTITINHSAGAVAPVNKTVTYGTATNIPGEPTKCWITQNLGADHQSTTVNDATEPSAGWYWQFNRKQGYKHDGTNRTPNTTWITGIDENSDWITANDPCVLLLGTGWRIPTSTEWTNVLSGGGWTNWNGPWDSALKIHGAGYLNFSNGSLSIRGSNGNYWSSIKSSNTSGLHLGLNSEQCFVDANTKAFGFSIRCIRD